MNRIFGRAASAAKASPAISNNTRHAKRGRGIIAQSNPAPASKVAAPPQKSCSAGRAGVPPETQPHAPNPLPLPPRRHSTRPRLPLHKIHIDLPLVLRLDLPAVRAL